MSSASTTTNGRVTRAATQAAGVNTTTTTTMETTKAPATATTKAKRPQTKASADEEFRKELEKLNKQPFLWGTQVVPPEEADLTSDFEGFAFSSEQITAMMAKRETLLVDGTAQKVFPGNGKAVEGTGPAPEKRVRKPSTRSQPKYQALVIFEDKDWVLFDHLQGYPAQHGTPPLAITKWAVFLPGNARVILQHTKSKALRSQSAPENLKGKTVDYTPSGPRIADFQPIRATKKKVAVPAPEPAEAPLLGRGARRQTRRPQPAQEAATTSQQLEAAPPAPAAPAPPATRGKKRKAAEALSEEIAPPAPTAAAPAAVAAKGKKRKAAEALPEETAPPAPTAAAPAIAAKGKKRKVARAPSEETAPPAPKVAAPAASKDKKRKAEDAPTEEPAPEKKKRRPGRPKKTPAIVENSSSE
ncbi:hypothetical protein Q7P37_005461 [Cladosporium fusiforme]